MPTVDELYEAFMDIDPEGDPLGEGTPFAEDVYEMFGDTLKDTRLDKTAWAEEYGMYLPTFDPAQTYLAERKQNLAYDKAMNLLETTKDKTDQVYTTELDTLSTELGREMTKGKAVAGQIGLRSGSLESAMQETIGQSSNKVKDLGDRLRISDQETEDAYNIAMVDAAIDFEKTERQEKEEFYDRTMGAMMNLIEQEGFTDPQYDPATGVEWDREELIMSGEGIGSFVPYRGEHVYFNDTYYFYHQAVEGNQSGYIEMSIDDVNYKKEHEGWTFLDDPDG